MANDTAKRLLARIRELREALGLSQEAFAERAGLKYKHYQAIEAGRKIDIRFSTLEKLAKACGLAPSDLLNFDLSLSEQQARMESTAIPAKPARKAARRHAGSS